LFFPSWLLKTANISFASPRQHSLKQKADKTKERASIIAVISVHAGSAMGAV
jgi:hypothetical protein